MSLLSWLSPRKKPAKAGPVAESSGLSRMEATRPASPWRGKPPAAAQPAGNALPANRKGERMARRELLYDVVRESMVRAGVLSASYKFKVLSLDARGRQFLVMVDLARAEGAETARLAEIEAMIAQGAKSRYDIVVTAVYWRMNEHVAVGRPGAQPLRATPPQPMPLEPRPAPLDSQPALASQPAPLGPASSPRHLSRYEPIEADEVAAFKQALAAGVARPAAAAVAVASTSRAAAAPSAAGGATAKAFDGSARHGPQSYTLLTGFEDTAMADADVLRSPALSGTQYGDLT